MGKAALVDASYLVALVAKNDRHHHWAEVVTPPLSQPWLTCEAALSESFYLLGRGRGGSLLELIRRGIVRTSFNLSIEMPAVLELMEKYSDVPMSLADACLVRMTELLHGVLLFTTDSDFKIYRRHGRKAIPCVMPD